MQAFLVLGIAFFAIGMARFAADNSTQGTTFLIVGVTFFIIWLAARNDDDPDTPETEA